MKLSSIKVNPQQVQQGSWIDDLPGWGGLGLKVRGLDNAESRALRLKLQGLIPAIKWQTGKVSEEETEKITNEILLETVLLDWRNLQDDDGKEIPYSKEFARELLFQPQWRSFRDVVLTSAAIVGRMDSDIEEDVSKN